MDPERFLAECNRSPLLREYRPITQKTLQEADFLRAKYTLQDLAKLEQILFFLPPEIVPLESKEAKREYKDFIHAELVQKYDNRKLIKEARKVLKMPFTNHGFAVLKRDGATESSIGINFETIEPTFEQWFFSWTEGIEYIDEIERIMKTSNIVHREISQAVNSLLEKWRLPRRYFKAVQELILFNAIIPARSGIVFIFESGYFSGEPRVSISIDIDTTKEELIEAIKEDSGGVFRNRELFLAGKVRKKKRKKTETDKMLEIYNRHKKDGKKDKDIFPLIQSDPEFERLSISAIRDRIKRR